MEQQVEGIKVEVISNEMVKPSVPASSHPPTFILSLLDQIFPAFHMPLLLFYTPPQPGQQVDVVAHLKASLSQTLDHFYPLAGQFVDDSTISCTDQGLPFVETRVNCHLADVLASSQKLSSLVSQLLPPQQYQVTGPQPISTLFCLPIQVNVFPCGGVVIGAYMLHKNLDAVSLGTFFKHWSTLALSTRADSDNLNLIRPDFEATVNAFPPLREGVEHVCVPDLYKDAPSGGAQSPTSVVVKSFKFNMDAITRLKAKAASKAVASPSRFEALAAFIWQQTMSAAAATTTATAAAAHNTVLSISVNMRPRTKPPLPRESMGNVVTNARVVANESNSTNLQELVQEIHTGLSHIDEKIRRVYQGEQGAEVLCRERKAESEGVMNCDNKGHQYQLSSLCYNGLTEADFGFGKPAWVVPIDGRPIPPTIRNVILFTDYKHPTLADQSGIEVWLYLDINHMHVLQSSPLFLAFASPGYSS